MALIKCSECGREVSDKAKTCPNCGASVKKVFCRHCGEMIDSDCVVCPKCGKQTGYMNDKNIIINNSANSSASSSASSSSCVLEQGKRKNKWISFFLCLFTVFGHKFYEGKTGIGILYICTLGLFGIGWFIDLISLAMKPNPYYV